MPKVLLIEDQDADRDEALQAIADAGLDAIHVETADQARAAALAEHIVYVMCDLRIPATANDAASELVGLALAEELHDAFPQIPVVVLSGHLFVNHERLLDFSGRGSAIKMFGGVIQMPATEAKSKANGFGDVASRLLRLGSAVDRVRAVGLHQGTNRSTFPHVEDDWIIRGLGAAVGAPNVHVRRFHGGRGGALVASVRTPTGSLNGVVKIHDVAKIDDEVSRYKRCYEGRLQAGVATHIVKLVHGGFQHRAGVLYSVAPSDRGTLFDVLASDTLAAERAVAQLGTRLQTNAMQGSETTDVSVGSIRATLISDDDLIEHVSEEDRDQFTGVDDVVFEARICVQHGDLHCGNILIADGDRPFVIDFGRAEESLSVIDGVTLELSPILHPDSPVASDTWPTIDQAERPVEAGYLDGCAYGSYVECVRQHFHGDNVTDDEVDAAVYAYALRQLKYLSDGRLRDLSLAFARGAAARLLTQ